MIFSYIFVPANLGGTIRFYVNWQIFSLNVYELFLCSDSMKYLYFICSFCSLAHYVSALFRVTDDIGAKDTDTDSTRLE